MKNVVIQKGNKLQETHGDIWPMTWVGNVTYIACNDTTGCPEFLYNKHIFIWATNFVMKTPRRVRRKDAWRTLVVK